MRRFQDTSIRRKLTLVIVLTSVIALLMATAAAIGYEFFRFHYDRLLELRTQAEIIEANSAAALAAHNRLAANKVLTAMQTQPEVVFARIFDSDGKPFAEYVRPDATAPPISLPVQSGGYRFEGRHVLFYYPISLNGRTIGMLVLCSGIHKLETRFIGGTCVLVGVMLASVLISLLVGRRLQRIISGPILDLARVTHAIAEDKDYSLRATKQSDDEIGVLTENFNQMLAQIQTRDAQLRASEQQFRQLAESIREVFWMSDPTKKQMIYISPGYEQIWGRTCTSLYASARDWVEAIHPEDRERVLEAALTRQISGQYDEEYRIVRPDGSIRWIHDRAFPVRDESGKVYRIAGIAEDITGRKELEKRLLEVTDREQARIGQDIHDGLSQQLVGASLNVALLIEDLSARAQPGMERADKIAALLNNAITQARTLARGLYPIKLETEGLLPALQELAMNVAAQSKIACDLESPQVIPVLDPTEAIHLYRIAQEAVNNALKHARAKRITISLAVENDKVRLTVSDDGVGIAVDTPRWGGMGLHIMRYRAEMIGGKLNIQPGKTGGTIISCTFQPKPVKENVIQELKSNETK